MRAAVLTAVVALGLGLALSSPASAQSTEQRYFSARDAAIAKVTGAMDAYSALPENPPKPKKDALDKVTAMNDAELAKLTEQMREAVGPVSISGFDSPGKINLDGLIKGDEGFGVLDGLTFTSADKKATIIVTTTGMFRHWLAEHKDWWGKNSDDIPKQPGRAVQQNAFYTQALVTDSAIVGFTELHVRKPLGSVFVYAMLGGRTQDAIPHETDEIYFAVGRRGHVFIGQSRNFAPVGPIPRCEAAWKAATSPPEDDKARKNVESRYVKCFAGWARYQPNYADAVRTAQQLINSVATP